MVRWFALAWTLWSTIPGSAPVLPDSPRLEFLDAVELARRSQVVLQGRVVSLRSRWSTDGTQILTDIDVDVTSVWRGRVADRVRITQFGGELEGDVQHPEAMAHFAPREEVVLFLSEDPTAVDQWHLTGMAQGKYRVEHTDAGPLAVPEALVGVRWVDFSKRNAAYPTRAPLPLADLRTRVDAAGSSRRVR
jgi:hypothetical protein